MHKKGMEAEQYVQAAAEKIAKTLKAKPKEIVFTSGGTESNNMAIIGAAMSKPAGRKAYYYHQPSNMPSVYNAIWLSGGSRDFV